MNCQMRYTLLHVQNMNQMLWWNKIHSCSCDLIRKQKWKISGVSCTCLMHSAHHILSAWIWSNSSCLILNFWGFSLIFTGVKYNFIVYLAWSSSFNPGGPAAVSWNFAAEDRFSSKQTSAALKKKKNDKNIYFIENRKVNIFIKQHFCFRREFLKRFSIQSMECLWWNTAFFNWQFNLAKWYHDWDFKILKDNTEVKQSTLKICQCTGSQYL